MQKFYSIPLLFFLLVLFISRSHSYEGVDVNPTNYISKDGKIQKRDSFDQLMGKEECDGEDDECLKRRVLSDAHLDYIYTQENKH